MFINQFNPHRNFKKYLFPSFLLIYFMVNLFFLTDFPYIHSDEAWLSGLSRVFINEFEMDYTFFDLYPTTHHTMKIFFLLIQGTFIKLFGYEIFTVRLISVIFSTSALIIFHKILLHYNQNKIIAFMFTILLALNLQWLMVSHMARQESVLIFLFLLAYLILLKHPRREVFLLATILGLGIGVHPNIIFLAIALGLVYLFQWIKKERQLSDLFKLIGITALYASLYLMTTFIINGNFLKEYHAYGNKLGVFTQLVNKLQNFYFFYYKLYHRISGTYFTVNLTYDYYAFVFLIILIGIYFFYRQKNKSIHLMKNKHLALIFFIGINLGLLILGRYNQISIIFPIVFLYLSLAVYSLLIIKNEKLLIYSLSLLIVLQGYHSYNFISQTNNESYDDFISELAVIKEDGKILANLNLEYAFKERLIDYRNLAYLDEASMTLEEYIEKNNIQYIVLYEEMDYIYRNQDKWYILYGSLNYYDALKSFLDTETTLIKSFDSPTYAMRIAKYVNTYPWTVRIYQLKKGSSDENPE